MVNLTEQKSLTHEFGNALAVISGYVDILADTNLSEEQRSLINKIYASLDLAKRIISNAPRGSRLALDTFLEETVSACEAFKGAKKIDFHLKSEVETGVFQVEEDKLKQVLMNLIKNAAKYTEEGVITVFAKTSAAENSSDKQTARSGSRNLEITVSDTGAGIREEYLPHIFEPFVQPSADKSGFGIGLPICKELVESMGGEIWAVSELAHGSSFCFKLPVKRV